MTSISKEGLASFSKTTANHILHVSQKHSGSVVKESRWCNLLLSQSFRKRVQLIHVTLHFTVTQMFKIVLSLKKVNIMVAICYSSWEPACLCTLQNQRIGSEPTSHTYWLTASLHNGSFLFPYSVLYHYLCVLGIDNDMYSYSTWVPCLIGSHQADNPPLFSLLLFISLSLSLCLSRHGAFVICPLTYHVFPCNDL